MKRTGGYTRDPKNKGLSRQPLYHVWKAIVRRCNNPSDPAYCNYGGRGIGICESWRSFPNFLAWAKESGHRSGLEIDRINNDGNYCPENCRIVSRAINNRNKRSCYEVEIDGEVVTAEEAARRLGMHPITLRSRLWKGWSVERALSQPVKARTVSVAG